jgi:hypothetical protein
MKGSTIFMKEVENQSVREPQTAPELGQPSKRDRPVEKVRAGKNIELLGPIILVILLMIVSSLFIGVL